MSEPISIPTVDRWTTNNVNYQEIAGYVEITDAIAAEIVRRALVHDDTVRAVITGLIKRMDDNTKPSEDDAALDELAWAISSLGTLNSSVNKQDAAEAHRSIADLLSDKNNQIATLRASLQAMATQSAQYMKDRDELRASLAHAENDRKQWKADEGKADEGKADEGKAAGERDKALADLAVLQCAFKASLAREHAIGVTLRRFEDALHNAQSERNAARAEVAALKARKVKLPPSFTVTNFCQPCLGEYDVHSAIRAAGVEVA